MVNVNLLVLGKFVMIMGFIICMITWRICQLRMDSSPVSEESGLKSCSFIYGLDLFV